MDYRVIKENDLFLLTDLSGDVAENNNGHGLYSKDTRFLSKLALTLNGHKLNMLSSEADENYISRIVLTNPKTERDGIMTLWPESVEVVRTRFIYKDALYESVKLTNFSPQDETFELELHADADFSDMFLIRGFQSGKSGGKQGFAIFHQASRLGTRGQMILSRKLLVRWTKEPIKVETGESGVVVRYLLELKEAKSTVLISLLLLCWETRYRNRCPTRLRIEQLRSSYAQWQEQSTEIDSDMPLFNRLYERGLLDIRVLLTDLGTGRFPVAGLPWFAVPFGRDSLIAALQLLPIHPEVAKGTILTMARYQGRK